MDTSKPLKKAPVVITLIDGIGVPENLSIINDSEMDEKKKKKKKKKDNKEDDSE